MQPLCIGQCKMGHIFAIMYISTCLVVALFQLKHNYFGDQLREIVQCSHLEIAGILVFMTIYV